MAWIGGNQTEQVVKVAESVGNAFDLGTQL